MRILDMIAMIVTGLICALFGFGAGKLRDKEKPQRRYCAVRVFSKNVMTVRLVSPVERPSELAYTTNAMTDESRQPPLNSVYFDYSDFNFSREAVIPANRRPFYYADQCDAEIEILGVGR